MADQRFYVIRTHADGTTTATEAMNWTPANVGVRDYQPSNIRYRSLTEDEVGLFPPAILGRTRTASLVRVWADDPQTGDTVQVVASNVAGEALPLLSPRGAAVQLTAGSQSATVLEVNMTDYLKLISTSARTIYIEVNDLSEEQHLAFLLAQQAINTNALAVTTETRVISIASGVVSTLAAWTASVLYAVVSSIAANGVLALPPLTDVPLGSKLRLYRDGSAAGDFFGVRPDGADLINGANSSLLLVADGMGAFIERTAEGWVSSLVNDDTTAEALAGNQALTEMTRIFTRINYTTGAGTLIQLPPIADSAEGQMIAVVIAATGGSGSFVGPTAGQALDGVTNKRVPLTRVGDTAIFRFSAGTWISYGTTNPVNQDVIAVVADPALGAELPWEGQRYYQCTYAANGAFTLPITPKVGQSILLRAIGANMVTVTAPVAVPIVSAGAAHNTLVLAANMPIHLRFYTGAWIQQ